MKPAKVAPIYPLLLAVYSPLALLAANLGQVALVEGLRALAAALLLGGLVYAVLRGLMGSWRQAAPLAALLLVLFFSYGHVYQLLEPVQIGAFALGRHRWLAPLWAALGALVVYRLMRRGRRAAPPGLHPALNLASAALVMLSAGQVALAQARSSLNLAQPTGSTVANAPTFQTSPAALPDVYWIILDGYGRADGLLEEFGLDNTPFLSSLEALGFVIPDCTLSNYTVTTLSVSSTLHMNYVENYTPFIQNGSTQIDWLTYHQYILDNPVRDRLEALGYRTVAFETGYEFSDITDADYFIVGNRNPLGQTVENGDITDFEEMFIRTTALRPLEEASVSLRKRLAPAIKTSEERRFDTVQFVLDQMPRLPEIEGPKFVTVHIMAPHPPFVFAADGSYQVSERAAQGYAPEILYLNDRILKNVRAILNASETPPIIVIQGDHGWEEGNRNRILNAYFLPGAKDVLYPTITPVNTFRIILNTYFGGQYPLLEDKSLSSRHDDVYHFTQVASSCVQK